MQRNDSPRASLTSARHVAMMRAARVTEPMLSLLRECASGPNGVASVPYRLGSAATAKALYRRRLIVLWFGTNDARMMTITDAGRSALAIARNCEQQEHPRP